MSLAPLSQEQLLELVNQSLAQVQLVPPTPGRVTPGAGLLAIGDATLAEPSGATGRGAGSPHRYTVDFEATKDRDRRRYSGS